MPRRGAPDCAPVTTTNPAARTTTTRGGHDHDWLGPVTLRGPRLAHGEKGPGRMMPIIGGHNDLPMQLRARYGYRVQGLDEPRPGLHTDLPRLRAGRVGGQFWSVYVPSDLSEPEAVVATLEQVDAVYRLPPAAPRGPRAP